jgi:hypothetical protein
MKKTFAIMMAVAISLGMSSCKENYSNGEKVGNLIEFTKKGVIWDSWEGRLNLTQTGMNTSGEPFEFSFDNDRSGQDSLINLMKQAQVEGWKLKIRYHEVWGLKNVFSNRGESDYFVDAHHGTRQGLRQHAQAQCAAVRGEGHDRGHCVRGHRQERNC